MLLPRPPKNSKTGLHSREAKQSDDDPDNDLTGGWIISTDYPAVLGWLYAFGSPVVKPGGDGYQLGTSHIEDAFTFLRQLYEQRCAWVGEDISVEDEFAGRSGLFASGSLSSIPYQQAVFRRAGNRDRWTVIPYPSTSGDPAISAYGPSFILIKSNPTATAPERAAGAAAFRPLDGLADQPGAQKQPTACPCAGRPWTTW